MSAKEALKQLEDYLETEAAKKEQVPSWLFVVLAVSAAIIIGVLLYGQA